MFIFKDTQVFYFFQLNCSVSIMVNCVFFCLFFYLFDGFLFWLPCIFTWIQWDYWPPLLVLQAFDDTFLKIKIWFPLLLLYLFCMFMNLNSVEDYILSSWHSVDKLRWIRLFRNWTKTSMNIIFRIALKSKKKNILKGSISNKTR